jgi:dolichyl-diphosphooligosaccharide--protein glycosyltransferase
MIFKKIPSWAIVLLLLIIIVAVALWLRIVLPYNQVFVGNWVKMTGVDAYYYMRLVDNLMKHFPQLTQFDPYLLYPGGWATGGNPDFFAYFMGGIIWLASLGKADQHMVDVIAVYIPPLLAVLTVLAAFFIGKALGSKWLGLLAAGLLAILPGEFLNRSLLGYTDHHIAEVLFSTGLMMFVFLAIKEGEGKRLAEMVSSGWKGIGKPVIYGLLGGMFLWLYILTWVGALLFAMIIFLFIVVQAILDHLRGRPLDYLGILGVCLFAVGLAMYLPWAKNAMTVLSLAIGLLGSLLLVVISRWMAGRGVKPLLYPLSLAGLAVAGTATLAIVSPANLQTMLGSLANMFLWPVGTTVMEMQPLLIHQGDFTFAVAVGNYMLAFFFSLITIGVLIYQVIKRGQPDKTLLLVWSVIILLSALAMRRSAYYYAVNVALLTGYLCWIPLSLLIKKSEPAPVAVATRGTSAKSRKRATQQVKAKAKTNMGAVALLLSAIALFVYFPNIGPLPNGERPAIDLATRPLFAPSNAWCEATDWLRANTKEPFGKPDSYYGLYKPVIAKGGFEYPSSAYGILAWWDYGYWTARIGHRPPATNPGVGYLGTAAYFTAQDWPSAARVINNLGTRYVIVDNEIAAYDGKFHALASLSGLTYSDFYDVFLQKQDNQYAPTILFYPGYYRSMIARLYNFDGKAVVPDAVNVTAYREITAQDGRRYKEITEVKAMGSYDEAQRFILDSKGKNYIIAGQDPYKSPVPLEELKGYKLVYASNQKISTGSKPQSNIKIFEYHKDVIPLTGDWNGDKKTKTGLWQPDGSFMVDMNGDGKLVSLGLFGYPTDVPLTGDWNGDGRTEIGAWRPTDLCFYLDYNGNGAWDPDKGDKKIGPFGMSYDDRPVTGDWNGDGRDEIGVWYRDQNADEGYCYLDVKGDGKWDAENKADKFGPLGKAGDVPVAGDWNGDGRDEAGVWEPGSRYFYLDNDRDGLWDAAEGDIKLGPYGGTYDTPIVGNWDGGNKCHVGVWDPYTRLFHLNISGDGKWGDDTGNIKLNLFSGF